MTTIQWIALGVAAFTAWRSGAFTDLKSGLEWLRSKLGQGPAVRGVPSVPLSPAAPTAYALRLATVEQHVAALYATTPAWRDTLKTMLTEAYTTAAQEAVQASLPETPTNGKS